MYIREAEGVAGNRFEYVLLHSGHGFDSLAAPSIQNKCASAAHSDRGNEQTVLVSVYLKPRKHH